MSRKKYRIASFNLYKFSRNFARKGNKNGKDLETIARIISENKVDILAIQEIFCKEAMNELLRVMNMVKNNHVIQSWDGRWESPNSRSVSAAEGYAFIWNTKRIQLSRNYKGKIFEPRIHNQYPHRGGVELIRNPFYGRFEIIENPEIEFRLLNTHIMFSAKRNENESENKDMLDIASDVTQRKREFKILAEKILPKICDKTYDIYWQEADERCRRPYTFLLGDYNLNLKESEATCSFIDEESIYWEDSKSKKIIRTVQKDLSTLQGTAQDGFIKGYRSNYDHFTYDSLRPIHTECWAVDFPNEDPQYRTKQERYNQYKDSVSDHLMIIMEIEFT